MNKLENNGTSPGEVLSVTFFVPISSLLLWLISIVLSLPTRFVSYFEMWLLNLVLLLSVTYFNAQLLVLFVVLGLFVLVVMCTALHKYAFKEINNALKSLKSKNVGDREFSKMFIGDYRGHLLLATSICILAVDFQMFPVRFAKTDTFGWSVMDSGVGSFVVLHGLCSSHGKSLPSQKNSLNKSFKSSFPLFVLGFIRLLLTTATGYHKVVSEYGVHWNFFFTLAFVKVVCSSILVLFNTNPGFLATITIMFHQVLLSKVGLADLILSDRRQNLLEANKEGICSLLGFIALYFCGVQMGHIAWKQRKKVSDYLFLLLKLCGIGLFGWLLMYLIHASVQPISRRMANLAYCIWVVSLTSLQIGIHLSLRLINVFLQQIFKIELCDILLWKAINHNGLFYFLIANLLTGVVNLVLNTNDCTDSKALSILILYLLVLSISSLVLYKYKVRYIFHQVPNIKSHFS